MEVELNGEPLMNPLERYIEHLLIYLKPEGDSSRCESRLGGKSPLIRGYPPGTPGLGILVRCAGGAKR